MVPKFKKIEHGNHSYELKKYGNTSFIAEFASQKDEWRAEFSEYSNNEKSFIPCPFCNSTNTIFTFRFFLETGTNTSGGSEETTYEVKCLKCNTYSIFVRIEDWGPGY